MELAVAEAVEFRSPAAHSPGMAAFHNPDLADNQGLVRSLWA